MVSRSDLVYLVYRSPQKMLL